MRLDAPKPVKGTRECLKALKADDEETYMKLIDSAKDTRITHLLRQTDAYLDSLAQAATIGRKGCPARTAADVVQTDQYPIIGYLQHGRHCMAATPYPRSHNVRSSHSQMA
ncbi:hypothetical protein CONPUDRAFT_160575 [Coniophora puteana RWD-64-598 SS2]|uniref:Uncharacterized protein n=1 Tax=Coniophora puteana (strain RWD-64-598) TaxID=741705 RepID=R7SCM6_CONPW|nr:uncharacterized protein CONPUDRAFT_160575 [Coniophora puteana RWD-64-598 SS2]EIW73913.1 hypothetical protein CONPUDRAFT_160575 [Coniophora puteana RWD-64-598 SS2]